MAIPEQKIGRFSCFLAYLSFVPAVGILLAPIIIIWGWATWNKGGSSLIHIGFGGLLFNIVLVICLPFYIDYRRKDLDNLHEDKHLRYTISELPEAIESIMRSEGSYPTSLEVFTKKRGEIRLHKDEIDRLHYKVADDGSKYVLLGVGADNKPFTADDILPIVKNYSRHQN